MKCAIYGYWKSYKYRWFDSWDDRGMMATKSKDDLEDYDLTKVGNKLELKACLIKIFAT